MAFRRYPGSQHSNLELFMAQCWDSKHECKIRIDWKILDPHYYRWKPIVDWSVVLRQLSPSGVHQMRWEFEKWIEGMRGETDERK